jgi:hypothetical protein
MVTGKAGWVRPTLLSFLLVGEPGSARKSGQHDVDGRNHLGLLSNCSLAAGKLQELHS